MVGKGLRVQKQAQHSEVKSQQISRSFTPPDTGLTTEKPTPTDQSPSAASIRGGCRPVIVNLQADSDMRTTCSGYGVVRYMQRNISCVELDYH